MRETQITKYPFRVHCSDCGMIIESSSPEILTRSYPYCAACEMTALYHDPERAWIWDGEICDILGSNAIGF